MPTQQQQINYGNTANDGQGDPLRTAFIKTDDNFDAIWNAGPVGSNVTILNNTVQVVNANGDLVLAANGVGTIQTNNSLTPRFANLYDLGSNSRRFRSAFVGSGGLNVSGNVVLANTYAQAVFTDGYFYANGEPFAGGGSTYGNSNVAAFMPEFLPIYNGNMVANTVQVNQLVTQNITNEFPVNITTNGGDTWQFAGNILRGPQGGTWQSSASTVFLNSPANGYVNISSLFGGNVVSEIFMEHSFIRFLVDNGGPEKTWQMNLSGEFSVPGDIIPQSNGTAKLGNATNQWGELWVAGNTVYIDSVPITVGAGNVLTVAGQPVLSNNSNATITTTGNITANYFIGNGSQLTGLPASYGNANVAVYLPTYGGNILVNRVTGNTADNLGYLQWNGNSSGDNNGYTTLQLIPDETLFANDQYLIIDPTAPQHIHIRAGGNIDSSSAELYLGGEENYVRVVDDTGVRLQNRTRNDTFYNFVDPADFNTATWFESGGTYFVQYTAVNPEIGDLAFTVGDDDENSVTVYYSGGAFSQTLTYGGSSNNLGGGVYRFSVVEAPPTSPTVLTAMDFEIWTSQTNFVTLSSNDFEVSVTDDLRITGNDTVSLRNRSSTDPVTIITDYDDSERTWQFGANGVLTLPDGANIANGAFNGGTASATVRLNAFSPDGNTVSIQAQGNTSSAVIEVFANAGPTTYAWQFGNTGNVTIPGNIVGTGTITIDNSATGNTADINLRSADDITLQGKDKPIGAASEGGDINLFCGDGSPDDGIAGAGSGGDIQLIAGDGGLANIEQGGAGGFVRLRGGVGGDASYEADAGDGGYIEIYAGNAGGNSGNADRGSSGGYIEIAAGDSTGNLNPGGDVTITSGAGGPNASAGQIELNVPPSDLGSGGTWSFNSDGDMIFPVNGQLVMDNGDGTIGNQGDDFVISWDNEELILRSAAGDVDVEADTDFNVRVNYDADAGDYLSKWIFTQNNDIVNITGNSSIVTEAGNLNLQGGRDTLSSGNVQITAVDNGVAVNTWTFDNTGVLTLPGEGVLQSRDDTVVLSSFNTSTGNANSVYLGSSGGVGFYDQEIGGNWLEIFRSGAEPEIRVPVGRGNLNIQTAEGENSYNWRFDNTGNLNAPGNIIVSSGVLVGNVTGTATTATSLISGNSGVEFAAPGANIELTVGGVGIVNISSNTVGVTGNISGGNILGNGASMTGVATQVAGSWNVTVGTNNYSFTVPVNGVYQLWVNGNIPNGIITYTATVSVTNNNVPVLGQQFAWNYEGAGNPILITSIPDQIVGTAGAISNASPSVGTTTNTFVFGISNTSGGNVTVNYGYTKLS